MMKLLYIIVIIVFVFVGLTFTYMNNHTVELNYFGFSGNVHLSLLLLGTLVVGAVCGYVASLSSSWKSRKTVSRLKRELSARDSKGV